MKDEEKLLLKELRLTLSKMELSLDAIDDAIVWVDKTGNIQWNNGCFARLTDKKTIELLDKPIKKFLILKKENNLIDWDRVIASKNLTADIYEYSHHGDIKYLEVSVRAFHKVLEEENIVIVLHDVTQKHLGEEQLRKSNYALHKANIELARNQILQSKLAAIVEYTEEAIIGRTLEGIIESWNRGAERLYGYKASEVIGQSSRIIYPEHRVEEFVFSMNEVKNGRKFEAQDTERLHKDGHIIPVAVTHSPIFNDKNVVIGSCSIARDITELKNMINLKNDFISTVSHELRTPLTSIQGSLSLLVKGVAGELPEKAYKLLKIGKENSERLIRLINDILDIQKIEAGRMEFHKEVVSVSSLIDAALSESESYAEQFNMRVDVTQNSNASVFVDKDRILQVLLNLISNAIKFSSSDHINLIVRDTYHKVRVEITNEGTGIPSEFHTRIFQKFSQAKGGASRIHKGTGLGLSISKEIVEKHGGSIGFISEENKSTTFYFELPMHVKTKEGDTYFPKKLNVLICESDETLALTIKNNLELNHINALVTHTADEARTILHSQEVEALLLDLLLPDADGISFVKELKTMHPHLLIIIISISQEEDRKILNGNALSVLDWIEKPVDLNRLVKAIKMIKEHTQNNAPNILHVEDDIDLLQIVGSLLQNEATITGATNLMEAKKCLEQKDFNLVILDLMLPDGMGIELLPILSEKNIPVIVFSAYELPTSYSGYVQKSLIKAKTSTDDFLKNIKEVLEKKSSSAPFGGQLRGPKGTEEDGRGD